MTVKYLSRALFVTNIFYCLCLNEQDFQAELKDLGVPERKWPDFLPSGAEGCVHFLVSAQDQEVNLVCLNAKPDKSKIEIYCILVHEAVHLWQNMKRAVNENRPSDEFEAYAIQSIAERLMNSYRKQTKEMQKLIKDGDPIKGDTNGNDESWSDQTG